MQTLNIVIKVLKTTNIHTFKKNCDIMVFGQLYFLAIYRDFFMGHRIILPILFPSLPS